MSASPGRTDYTQTASQELFLRKKILGTPSRRTLMYEFLVVCHKV